MNRTILQVSLSLIVLVAGLATGCGKNQNEISGTVTFGDKPLPLGTIAFFNEETGRSISSTVSDGRFTLTRVPIGEKIKVVVSTADQFQEVKDIEQKIQASKPILPPDAPKPPEQESVPEELVKKMQDMKARLLVLPERYQSVETTPLVFAIKTGKQELTIKVESQ